YDELREFIRTHHHLPNIPDAESIKKDGIKVGDMQIRMMEKIEELTLYILDMEANQQMMEKQIKVLTELNKDHR
ncbi:MAG: hypothetical protein ABIQ02_02715, partial [Saprospiraceae bacterium]